MNRPDFKPFPKLARFRRDCIITEKIDGTNAQILITDAGDVFAGSRTRWITPENDNFGFAAFVEANKQDLLKLGPGQHFGEWWGRGIQRGYGLRDRKFSLFNTSRWSHAEARPACCDVVPLFGVCNARNLGEEIERALTELRTTGSRAAPFLNPEGIVIFHTASGQGFKITLDNDEKPKSLAVVGAGVEVAS